MHVARALDGQPVGLYQVERQHGGEEQRKHKLPANPEAAPPDTAGRRLVGAQGGELPDQPFQPGGGQPGEPGQQQEHARHRGVGGGMRCAGHEGHQQKAEQPEPGKAPLAGGGDLPAEQQQVSQADQHQPGGQQVHIAGDDEERLLGDVQE